MKNSVGRPNKDGRRMHMYFDNHLYADLCKLSDILGCTKTDILEKAFREYAKPFRRSDGTISVKEGMYLETKEEYDERCKLIGTTEVRRSYPCKIIGNVQEQSDGHSMTIILLNGVIRIVHSDMVEEVSSDEVV